MKADFRLLFGLLGFIGAGIFMRPLYYDILPFEWGMWIDSFPFSLIASVPGYIVGSIFGIVVGYRIGGRFSEAGLVIFICAFLGGILGSIIISFFFSYTYFLIIIGPLLGK